MIFSQDSAISPCRTEKHSRTAGTLAIGTAVIAIAALGANENLKPAQVISDQAFTRVSNYGEIEVRRKALPDGSSLAALINLDKRAVRTITAYWLDVGLPQYSQAVVTSADGAQVLGRYAELYTAAVKPDSVLLVRIVPDRRKPGIPGRVPTSRAIAAVSRKPLNARRLDLSSASGAGTFSEPAYSGRPDGAGVLERYAIKTPAFVRGVYFGENFPIMGNTTGPKVFGSSFTNLPYGGIFTLLELRAGGYVAIVPVSGSLAMTWFEPDGDGLILNAGTRGTAPVIGDLPLLAWARANDPYEACWQAWRVAIQMKEVRPYAALRGEKTLPEYFRHLGWCSFEQFRLNINEGVMRQAMRDIRQSTMPVRWVLIDDGHVSNRDGQLTSFKPNENFPNGFESVLREGRESGVRWFGLWYYMSGYGSMVDPQNDLGIDQHLREIFIGRSGGALPALLPKGDRASADAFYSGLFGPAKKAGFDFIKVDFQGYHLNNYTGTENPVATAQVHYQAVEEFTKDAGLGLLNCLSMNHLRIFNTRASSVMRASRDYRKDADTWNKEQTWRAFHNSLWLGQTMWLDQDMAHSSDQVAGQLLCISKALSGGPVYLSDDPKFFYAPNVRPLALENGELLRPLAPAVPAPENVFSDPLQEAKAYKVVSPEPGHATAVGVYNLTEKNVAVETTITAEDYRAASAMLQPYPGPWPVPKEGLVVYDWMTGKASRLSSGHRTSLPIYSMRLFHLLPIRNGWAVIGRTDKYLSPAGVEVVQSDERSLTLRLKENGPVAIWSASGTLESKDAVFNTIDGALWRTTNAVAGRDGCIHIQRRSGAAPK